MDKRTKILAGLFGAIILYGFFSGVIYPTWIEPLVTIDDRIAERQGDLDKLEAQVAEVNKAKYEYREWAARTGGFDINDAVTEIRERLNKLLAKHKLVDVKTTPTRPADDSKTGLWKASVTVSGAGALDSVVLFLRDVAELPHVCRIGNAAISPASVRGKNATINRFNFRVPVEVWVVPQNQIVGRLNMEDLVHPEFFIRHQGQDYASIWKGDPFNPYVEMRVKTRATLMVLKDQKKTLDAVVEGGVGPYRYQWTPPKGLAAPKTRSPALDSSKVGRVLYTVSVTDARGNVGNSSISVTVSDPPPPPPPPTRRKDVPKRDPVVAGRSIAKDGRFQTLTMVLMRESENDSRDEIMVNHARSKQTSYYTAGDPFEGGELIFVHQTGGLVNWKDEYFVYPIGETLDHFVSAVDAFDFPVLQRAAGKHMDLMREMAKLEDAKKKAESPAAKRPSGKPPAGKSRPTKQTPANVRPTAVTAKKQAATSGKNPAATSALPRNAKERPTDNAKKAGTTKNPGQPNKSGEAKKSASPAKKEPPTPSGKKATPVKQKKRRPRGQPK